MAEVIVPEKFHLPFYKLQLAQLNSATKSVVGDWVVKLETGKEVPCYMVWLQGIVDFIFSDKDSVQLSDGRGSKIKLLNLSGTPGGSKWVSPGQYLQVIGQLTEVVSGVAQIKCTKLTDLSTNKHMQQMWDLEVTELHNLLSDKISFK